MDRKQFKAGGKRIFGSHSSKSNGLESASQEPKKIDEGVRKKMDDVPEGLVELQYGVKMIKWHYQFFDGLGRFIEHADNQLSKPRKAKNSKIWEITQKGASIRIRSNSGWYGYPMPKSIQELEGHDRFIWMDTYKRLKREVKKSLKVLKKIKNESNVQTKKRAYNSMEIGIFSFDRAAIGLHYANGKGGSKLTTNFKEVYAYNKHSKKPKKTVRIYMPIGGGAGKRGEELIYNGLSAAILKEGLEVLGVQSQINMVSAGLNGKNAFVDIVRVKDYHTKLSLNDLLLLGSSPRWFRYKGFKTVIAQFDKFGYVCPPNLGSHISADKLIHKLNEGGKADYFILKSVYSQKDAVAEITRILDTIKAEK